MNGTKYDLGTAAQQFYKRTCLFKKDKNVFCCGKNIWLENNSILYSKLDHQENLNKSNMQALFMSNIWRTCSTKEDAK